MTGPEHYLTAEKLAVQAARYPDSSDALVLATLAQVHATLAHAAATAMNGNSADGMAPIDFEAWDAVAGVQRIGDAR